MEMKRTTRRGVGIVLTLSLLLTACGRDTTMAPDGTIALTVASYLGQQDGDVMRQGVPSDAAGLTGVAVAELRVFQGEIERFFDADGRQVDGTAPPPQLTPVNGSVTLFLLPGTYSFELTALDDAVGPNPLAYGELLDQAISDATTVTIPLRSYVGSASLSEPRIVQPNEIFEVILGAHPPGRPDLQVPLPDFEVTYALSDEALRIGDSKLGVRLVAACRDITIGATVSDTFQNSAPASRTILVQDLCPPVGAAIGADLIPPFVSITGPAEGSSVAGPITVTGEVNDMQSGVNRVEIYEGVVLLGTATIDTTSMPSTWAFTFSPLQARTYAITALALDNAGNEARTARALEGNPTLGAELLWTRQFGTSVVETGNAVAVEEWSGNVYVTGTTRDGLEGTNAGGDDVFLRKYDPDGNVLWTRQFGTVGQEEGNAVAVDENGGVYVTGTALFGIGEAELLLLKYGADGSLAWTRQFGAGSDSYTAGAGVAVDGDLNVYVTGSTTGNLEDGGPTSNDLDLFLRKYAPDGNVLWTRQLFTGDVGDDIATGVAVDANDIVYVTGYTFGAGAFPGAPQSLLLKYAPDGTDLWVDQFTSGSTEESDGIGTLAHGVAVSAFGDIYVAGSTNGSFEGTNAGGDDVFLRKYDSFRNVLWTRQFGTGTDVGGLDSRDIGNAVAVDASGNAYVAGATRGSLEGTNAGGDDVFLRKYDPDGNVLWTRQFGSGNGDLGRGVASDASGSAYVTGTTSGGSLDGTSVGGTFLRKYGP